MASYAENPQNYKYTPYIQQQPLELMQQVGNYKQAKYEEGVQKIQSHIDQVAGMDIANDTQKQYLQSKLNSLGENLKFVAAGDFSDFQLVNSVTGMTNKIGKDALIQNAVGSTAKYRKDAAFAEKELKEGKSSAENQYDFQQKANNYLSSKDVNASYNGRYKQYINLDKKWEETLKGLHSSKVEEDIAYVKSKGGKVELAEMMQRIEKEGIPAEKIRAAIESSFTPDDLEQLQITANYRLKGATHETLAQYITNQYSTKETNLNRKIERLNTELITNKSDPEEYAKTQKALNDYTTQLNNLPKDLSSNLEEINTNPDSAKYNVYKEMTVDQFANSHSWENKKANYMSNPGLEEEHRKESDRVARAKLALDVRQQNFDEQYKTASLMLEKEKISAASKKAEQDAKGVLGDGEVTFQNSTVVPDAQKIVDAGIVDGDAVYSNFIKEYVNYVYSKGGTISSAEVRSKIKDYELTGVWKDTGYKDYLDKALDAKKESRKLTANKETINMAVNNDPNYKLKEIEVISSMSKIPPVTITDNKGRPISVSASELATLKDKLDKHAYFETKVNSGFSGGGGSVIGSPTQLQTKFIPLNNLTDREKLIYYKLTSSKGPEAAEGVKLSKGFASISEISNKREELQKYKKELYDKKFDEMMPEFVPRGKVITVGDKESTSEQNISGTLSLALSQYDGSMALQKIAEAETNTGSLTKEKIKALTLILGDKEKRKNLTYIMVNRGEDISVLVKDGVNDYIVPIPKSLETNLPKDLNRLSGDEFKMMKQQEKNNGNTNPSLNGFDSTLAHFTPRQLPLSKSKAVFIDFQQVIKGNPNSNIPEIKIMITNEKGEKVMQLFQLNYKIDSSKVNDFKSVDDSGIWAMVKDQIQSGSTLEKQVKKALKL